MSRTQIEKDFAQLYIGQNRKLLVENYYKKKKRILTLLFLAGLSIVSVIFWQGLQERKLEGGNKLERNDYGQGRKEVELEVQLGEEKWQPLLVTLEELEYSFEEIEEGFDKVEEMLPEIILGKNQSVDRIESDLNFPQEVEGYPLYLSWRSSNPKLLDDGGSLHTQHLSQEGELIQLTVKMEYDEWEREHSFFVRVVPAEEKKENSFLLELSEKINQAEEAGRKEKTVELPREWKSGGLKWRYPIKKGIFILPILFPLILSVIWWEKDKEVHKEAEKRKGLLQEQYPEFVTKLILFMEAGMTAQGAFFRMAEDYQKKKLQGKREEYLYEELQYICRRMKNGMAQREAYELLGSRCGLPLYRKLSTLLIQNLQKGAAGMLDTLRQESWKVNEERKNQIKRKGEEAGTKLLFPMMLMLGMVMILVIVPACFAFQV